MKTRTFKFKTLLAKSARVATGTLAAAAMLLLTQTASYSADASPRLSYTTGDANSAYIVTGNSINIREVIPAGGGYISEGLRITYSKNNTTTELAGNGISISAADDNVRSLEVKSTFNPADPENAATTDPKTAGTFSVTGVYYALRAEGTMFEQNTVAKQTAGSLVISQTDRTETTVPIMEYSTLTLKCDNAEGPLRGPTFSVSVDGTGAFKDFTAAGSRVMVTNFTQGVLRSKEIQLTVSNGNRTIDLTLYPQLNYVYKTVNAGEPTDRGETVYEGTGADRHPVRADEPDNFVRAGTTFEIEFRMPESNSLLLEVMTPQNAIERVETQIAQNNGEDKASFVKLEKGDSLNYITNNFELRRRSPQFNSNFEVEWQWIPDDPNNQSVLNTNGGNSDWRTAQVSPLEDDVVGQLRAIVYYIQPDGTRVMSANVPDADGDGVPDTTIGPNETAIKNIVIRGIGKPVGVTRVSQTTGAKDGAPVKVTYPNYEDDGVTVKEDDTLPDAIRMDAYTGNIPEYSVSPVGPYEYEVLLNMGAKNGAAQYATVTATGNADAVNIQTQQGSGALMDYKIGDRINNERYGINDNADANLVRLVIRANRLAKDANQQNLTLTFHYYIPDRNNIPQESSRRTTLSISVVDNTPSQDSTLKSLQLRDQDGNLIEFSNFSPDQFRYTGEGAMVHMPYKTRFLNITPVFNDARGAARPAKVVVLDTSLQPVKGTGDENGNRTPLEIKNGASLPNNQLIDFSDDTELGLVYRLEITVPSQDPREQFWSTYIVEVMRDYPSTDNTLANFGLYFEDDTELANNLIKFDPETLEYNVQIPYSTKRLRVRAEANHDRAELAPIEPALVGNNEYDPDLQWLDDLPTKFRNALGGTTGGSGGSGGGSGGETPDPGTDPGAGGSGGGSGTETPDPGAGGTTGGSGTGTETGGGTTGTDTPGTETAGTVGAAAIDAVPLGISDTGILDVTNTADTLADALSALDLDAAVAGSANAVTSTGNGVAVQILADPTDVPPGVVQVKATVTSEAGTVRQYVVNLRRMDPNDDPTLSGMLVTDKNDVEQAYRPGFTADHETYVVDIPYSVKQIKFNLTATDKNVNNIQVYQHDPTDPGNLLFAMASGELKLEAPSPAVDVLAMNDDAIIDVGYHSFFIVVTAEDERTKKTYEVRVQRALPSTDARLESLEVFDQDGEPLKMLPFHPDTYDYLMEVPYETTHVSFTPTAAHEWATIRIKEDGLAGLLVPYDIESGALSKRFELKAAGEEKVFDIVVTAEDGKTQLTYTVRVKRAMPSSDARLKALTVDGVDDFSPLFVANRNEYTALVTLGVDGVVITPTANHDKAIITVDGLVVESGTPSGLIELIEVEQRVEIVVTAQDGVTKNTYTIDFTNQNLMERTNNADLADLKINDGLMTPDFEAAVTEYEVVATERTYSVDIVPTLDDPLATYRVLNDTRELGDYNGNYGLALQDGETNVTVEVTSPDGTVTKDYTVTIYRNVEEKLKEFEPLEAEDIDFENAENPIIVKIEEFPRIGASVFNELRNHPELSIIFQGNDYALRFDAANLTRVIPQAEIYDFRMSFASPDAEKINTLIDAYGSNADIAANVVQIYFSYHGSLPGPATLNLNLSNRYGNQILYWHYYNQDRDRIDYYGSLHSNNQGTIAVSIDHFSTYLVSPGHRIAGSEDRSGIVDALGMVSNGRDMLYSGGKLNPDTAAEEEEEQPRTFAAKGGCCR